MRNSVKRHLAFWTIFFFLFSITGCGGGGGGSDTNGTDSASQTADLQNHLTTFNMTMDWVATDLPALGDTVNQLNTAMAEDDGSAAKTSAIDTLVDQFADDADMFLVDVQSMDATEAEIQKIINPDGSRFILVGILATGLAIKGLYSFGQAMKGYSDEMTQARKERDQAQDDLANNVPGALTRYNNSLDKMKNTGMKAEQEFTTKVATDLMTGGYNPTSATGVVLKDIAGNKLQKGLKVISATKECQNDGDSGCKIGVSKTDDYGSAVATHGDVAIVVGGGDMARAPVKETIPSGVYTEVKVDPIPITEATPQKIADQDDAANGDDDTPVNPTMTLSADVSSETDTNITYAVTAAISGVTYATAVTITIDGENQGNSTRTLTADGTVTWSVIVEDEDVTVTVRRSDTGDQQSLTLSGKSYDGTYVGTISVTYNPEGWCEGGEITLEVSGGSVSADGVSGTITGNEVSFAGGDWVFSGTITGNVMSGTWHDTVDPCSGSFSLTKQ